MSCLLRDDLYAVVSGGRTVFLDARHDRYFAIESEADAAFQRLQQRAADDADCAALAPLVDAGLLNGDPSSASLSIPTRPLGPIRQLSTDRRVSVAALLRCAVAQLHAQRLLRRTPLPRLRALLQARRKAGRTTMGAGDSQSLAAAAGAFDRAGLVFHPLDRCLPHSLAFCLVAHRIGVPAMLVLGVRANPFAAHAWAQHGDVVLNDTLERVRQFTPILAL